MKLFRYLGLISFLIAPMAFGQYGRLPNCQLQNAQGQAVAGAQVYLLSQPANVAALTPKATIYSNATGAGGAATQPIFTDGFGQCTIYAAPGLYTVVYNSPLTGILSYPDQLIGTTGGAVFTPTGIPYVISPTSNTVATNLQIQTQGGLGVHTNAYLNPDSGTFLYSPLGCANAFSGPTCVDATAAIAAAKNAAKLTGAYIISDAAPPGFGVFFTQLQAFAGEGGIVCGGRHYEQGCPWYQIPGTNLDFIVPDPGLPSQHYIDYYLIDSMAFYGDFTYTSTVGNCITFGPQRVGERTNINRTTCNNWPNNGFNVNGGSDPLFFTDTEASGNGFGSGGGFGWNFTNTGGNTFDMVTLNGWSADNNFSGAINVKGTSNYFCNTCGDSFIFRSGKMESRFDNLHIPNGQPIGILLDTTSGTPVIIDGLSAISVTPGGPGFAISTAVRGGGSIVVTTPTPHVPAVVGSSALVAGNSQGAFNAILPITASTQTTTTLTQAGGSLTGGGGNIFFDVVTDSLVKIIGNSANVKLNGVTMAGGLDSVLGTPYGWYNIIHDVPNNFTNNITQVPSHTVANGASFVTAQYLYPLFCADQACVPVGWNVAEFGAKCDGSSDDTAAFNATAVAVQAYQSLHAGLQTINIPSGSCVLAGQVTVFSNQYWHGNGTLLVPTQVGHTFYTQNSDHVTFDNINITVTTPGTANPDYSAIAWLSVADSTSHVGFTVKNSNIKNSAWGITAFYNNGTGSGLSDVSITGNTITSNTIYTNGDGIHLGGKVSNFSISGNHVSGRGDAAIALTSEVVGGTTYQLTSGSVTNNVCLENLVGLDNSGATYVEWSGNFVKATTTVTSQSNPAYRQVSYPATSSGVYPVGVHAFDNYLYSGGNSGFEVVAKIDAILPSSTWVSLNSSFEKNVIDGPNNPMYIRGKGFIVGDNTLVNGGPISVDYDGTSPQNTANLLIGSNKWLATGAINFGAGCLYSNVTLMPQTTASTLTFANLSCLPTSTALSQHTVP